MEKARFVQHLWICAINIYERQEIKKQKNLKEKREGFFSLKGKCGFVQSRPVIGVSNNDKLLIH